VPYKEEEEEEQCLSHWENLVAFDFDSCQFLPKLWPFVYM
jgi:hypothetical protein